MSQSYTAERWRRIKTLFERASELSPEERHAFLKHEVAGDAELLNEVEALLLQDTGTDSSPEQVVADVASAYFHVELVGQTLSNYKVLKLLGEGGMGQVYLAQRDDEHYRQKVALKVLGLRRPTQELIQRFRIERQILANLEHPNIAHLIDGGETEDGAPFLVMEYVDGRPIDDYCDDAKLTTEQRLAMFCKVCLAVDHAHRNLVIHRDIKPSNILVNDQAEPKLLDFGIAKLLHDEPDVMKTQSGARLMSPLNASPEQVKGTRVTVATDVYSLGVLLYQMLTGQQPYTLDDRSAVAVERAICETHPPTPSSRLTRSGELTEDQLQSIAEARNTDPPRLRRKLDGDLDNIVLKALDKDVERRYNSALEFAQDIQRFLSHLPVQARKPSLVYRTRKFVQRNRVPTAVGAIGMLALLTSIGISVNRIAQERDVANLERAKALEINEFMQSIFESANPNLAAGENTTARELLDIGARDVNARFDASSGTRITMLRVLGEAFYYLGNYSRAEELLRSALASDPEAIASNRAEIASTKLVLGLVQQYLDEWEEANALMAAAEQERQQIFGRQSMEVVHALLSRAFLVETQGDLDEAVSIYREGLAIANRVTEADHDHKAVLMSRLSGLYRYLDRYDEAEPLVLEARAMQQRLYGKLNLELADTERQLAGLYRDIDELDKASPLYEKVIADVTTILGKDHPEVGNVYNSYAILLSKAGNHAGAIEAAKEFLRIIDLNTDGPSIDHSIIHNNIAAHYKKMKNSEMSEYHYRKAIEMQNAAGLAEDHVSRAYPLFGLGNGFYSEGRYEEAEPLQRQALALFLQNFEVSHLYVSRMRVALALTLAKLERHAEAEQYVDAALEQLRQHQGDDHAHTQIATELKEEIQEVKQ